MKVYVPLFLSILLLVTNVALSQNDTITTKIITFEDGDFGEEANKEKDIRNIIKVDPLLFLFGDIPLFYERTLNSKFSVEVGVGFTTRDYWKGTLGSYAYSSFEEERVKHIPHPSFKLAGRFYPAGYAPEEFYLALEYSYRAHEEEISKKEGITRISKETINSERIFNEFKLILGSQGAWGYSNHFALDYYIGGGIRQRDITDVKEEVSSGLNDIVHEYEIDRKKDWVPAFYLGVKIGYAF